MGTRADFYVRSKTGKLNYKGSIAWDGYPEGIPNYVLSAGNSAAFCHGLYKWFKHDREDATKPSQGWPWPWKNSNTTDYSYVFNERTGKVVTYKWGKPVTGGRTNWPDMTIKQAVTFGNRSGLLVFGIK